LGVTRGLRLRAPVRLAAGSPWGPVLRKGEHKGEKEPVPKKGEHPTRAEERNGGDMAEAQPVAETTKYCGMAIGWDVERGVGRRGPTSCGGHVVARPAQRL